MRSCLKIPALGTLALRLGTAELLVCSTSPHTLHSKLLVLLTPSPTQPRAECPAAGGSSSHCGQFKLQGSVSKEPEESVGGAGWDLEAENISCQGSALRFHIESAVMGNDSS